jgi:GTP cyclohydrolase I
MTTAPPDAAEIAAMHLRTLDPRPDREGMRETPERVAAAWAHWTSGYAVNVAALLKTFDDGGEGYDEMVFVGSIPFYSHCEHHFAPFFGLAHVAYIPDRRILGLSKIPRIVDAFSRRFSVQERITTQIAETLDAHLKPIGVGVVLQARHLCIESRGVAKHGTITQTTAVRGALKDKPEARAEFFKNIDMQRGTAIV